MKPRLTKKKHSRNPIGLHRVMTARKEGTHVADEGSCDRGSSKSFRGRASLAVN